MARFLFTLAFALFLGQATGMSTALAGDECSQRCPGDAPDGQCPPACQFCTCCSMPQMLAAQPGDAMPAPAVEQAALAPADKIPSSPEPGDIFHVPKLLA